MSAKPKYSPREELIHSVTHACGLGLAISGLCILMVIASTKGTAWHVVSCAIYGTTLILMFLASTLYHGIRHPKAKWFFRHMDHMGIYLIIAGTYTPFALINLRGSYGWLLFGVVWAGAVIGIMAKVLFGHRLRFASVTAYLLMGWAGLFVLGPSLKTIPESGLWLLLAGGITYSVGVIFYALKRIPYHHVIWHLFVIGGSVCHFLAVWRATLA